MRPGSKGQARLQMKHRASLCVVFVFPIGADQEFLPHGDGLKIFLPIVDPILLHAGCCGDGVWNPFGVVPLAQKSDRLRRIFFRTDIYMHQRFCPVLL